MSEIIPSIEALQHQERIIRRGLAESAQALRAIRDDRLYELGGFASFEDYCRERLGFGRGRADQIIGAGATLAALPTNVGTGLNEAQLRLLAPFRDHPETIEEIVTEARTRAGAGKLTAKIIGEVIEERAAWAREETAKIGALIPKIIEAAEVLMACGFRRSGCTLLAELDRMMTHPHDIEDVLNTIDATIEAAMAEDMAVAQ